MSLSGGLLPEEIEIFKKGGAVFNTGRNATAKARVATILENLAKDCRSVVDDSRSLEEVAELLHIAHMDAEKRASRNPPELYAFTFEGSLCFSGWQFHGSTTIPHLRSLLASTLGTINPVGLTRFMLHDNIDLEVDEKPSSPRDWLVREENADPLLMIVRDL